MTITGEAKKTKRSLAAWKSTTELPLSGDVIAEVERIPLSTWIVAGRVPEQIFSEAMSTTIRGGEPEETESQDFKELVAFAMEVARASLKWPRVIDDGQSGSDDEIEVGRIPFVDLMKILSWNLNGAQGLLVQTNSGEMSVGALRQFRENEELQSPGTNGREVRQESGD